MNRRQAILEALACELERRPAGKITTAVLAQAVGVSEAALYRHFPSKAQMFEALILFAEEGLFSRINQIMSEATGARERCSRVLYLVLGFADRNPGITRILLGHALLGEQDRLHERVQQVFSRLELQFRQILREVGLRADERLLTSPESGAALLCSYAEGRLQGFVRSRFRQPASADWAVAWDMLQRGLFAAPPPRVPRPEA